MRLLHGFFIRDEGDEIAATSYFESAHSQYGVPYLSWSGACARLLLPAHRDDVADMVGRAGRVLLRPSQATPVRSRQRLDIVLDDEHDPLTATLLRGALSDVALTEEDHGLEFRLTAWTRKGKLLELPATYRA